MQRNDGLLEVDGLTTVFDTEAGVVEAVKAVSFAIGRGESVGLVGESGSGKSVTSYSVMRLLPAAGRIAAGRVLFDGVDLSQLSEDEMRTYRGRRIAMIFQEPMTSLNPSHRCGRQVQEAIDLHLNLNPAQAKERVLDLFRKVELPDVERIYDSYPHQLSGGQLQRVMIAMAISCDPQLLIADEPTTALDVTVQKSIIQLLRNLQAETGMSMLFISHDLGVISEIADRVLVMRQGSVVESGAVADMLSHPQHPYTEGLIACRPPKAYRLSKLPTVQDFLAEDGLTIQSFKESHLVTQSDYAAKQAKLAESPEMLRVEHLKKYYPGKKSFWGKPLSYTKAVDDVSFVVRRGETLGLVGESGCGKSTLGRTILRLADPTSGRILFDGRDITALSPREMRPLRKDLQIIFQDPYSSLNPRMQIGRAIQEPMQLHGLHGTARQQRERVAQLLEWVGLEADHYSRYPHEFSGGQRQRICIARTLAVEPRFVICDESVSALDVSVQAQVLNLLDELKQRLGLTYIFISHDLSVVKHISDRIMVMQGGQIVERGDAETVFHHPREAYTQRLIASIPGSDFS